MLKLEANENDMRKGLIVCVFTILAFVNACDQSSISFKVSIEDIP